MKTIKKVKYKSGDLILRKNGGLILLVTTTQHPHGISSFLTVVRQQVLR